MAKINTELLINKVKSKEDLVLYKEACNCYLNNSFRAAYIMSWLAIVESLKRRVLEFSNSGDKQAIAAYEKIEKLETNKKSADIEVLKASNELEIIGDDDMIDLDAFFGKRGIYVHPYQLEPNETEVNYILNKAVEIVLSKENRFGKGFLNNYIEQTLKIRHSISSKPTEIEEVASNIIGRLRPSLFPYFFKTLLYEISSNYNDTTSLWYIARCRRFVLQLLIKVDSTELKQAKWRLTEKATTHPEQFLFAICSQQTWSKIPEEVKNIIFRYISDGKFIYSNYLFKALSRAIDVIEEQNRTILDDISKKYQLTDSNSYLLLSHKKRDQRIIKALHNSDFDIQNNGLSWLEFGLKGDRDWLGIESSNEIRKIGQAMTTTWISQNYKRPSTLIKILQHPTLNPEFLNGYFYGVFFKNENEVKQCIELTHHAIFFSNVNMKHDFNEEVKKIRKMLLKLKPEEYPLIQTGTFDRPNRSANERNTSGLYELLEIIKK